jgi:hypothetical protein
VGQISSKLRRAEGGYAHWRPACEETHVVPDGWAFDGNLERPTFSPSVKITGVQTVVKDGRWTGEWVLDEYGNAKPLYCHYVLTAGVLNFCGDCTHKLVGQAVPLPDLPDWLQDDAPCP